MTLKEAIEAADGACPCTRAYSFADCMNLCHCARPQRSVSPCRWPGHAAIRAVAMVAQESMRERAGVVADCNVAHFEGGTRQASGTDLAGRIRGLPLQDADGE